MSEQLTLVPVTAVKAIVDRLADLGIDPLHLHIDGSKPTDARPNVRLWLRTRTDFNRFIDVPALAKKKVEERSGFSKDRQREFYVEDDTDERRLLIQCVSFPHHDDWEAAR